MLYFNLRLIFLLFLTIFSAHAQESADDFSQRGISRFEKNDLDGAIADFTKAIELKGHQLQFCFYFRGIALYRRGRLDEAISDLTKAISLKQHPRFYDDRANLLAQRGDFDGAIADLNRAIEIEPRFAKGYGDRGIVHLMRGEDAEAESDFRKCFEIDKTLEFQFKATASQIKRQAVLRAEHQAPVDVEIVKFSWNETPSRRLRVPEPVVPAATTPLSQSGLRILGDPNAKDQPGPPTGVPAPEKPDTEVLGFDQKFTASIKNIGGKTIITVQWAYLFVAQDPKDGFAHIFTTKINLPPGKGKDLREQVPWVLVHQNPPPSAHSSAQFKERVVILRLDYSDGTSWKSSGGTLRNPARP